ncbi:MAG: ATP-binding cassette domain-containing protein [Planctomycetota bacterium]
MIDVEGLTIGFGDTILLRDLSFRVPKGEVFAILGRSGCGKTTLLRHLIGLEAPLSGRIHIEGLGLPTLAAAPPPFGVLFQSAALFGSLTVGANVALPLRQWTDLPEEAIETITRSKLCLVGLRGYEYHHPSEISGGMKKRAGIARALVMEPPLLFLDEPSAGLDPVTAVELDDLILTLNASLGVTMVVVTHELASILRIAKSCIMLDRESQGIIARGDPRELGQKSADPRVTSFFSRRARGG